MISLITNNNIFNRQSALPNKQNKVSHQAEAKSLQNTPLSALNYYGVKPFFGALNNSDTLIIPPTQAETTAEFVSEMGNLIKNSKWVSINKDRLEEFANSFDKAPEMLNWDKYISEETAQKNPPDISRAMFELALNLSNQSGFITGKPGEKADKWEVGGSGSKAMVALTRKMREEKATPGIDFQVPSQVDEKITPMLEGVPFKEHRIAIFKELAEPGAQDKFERIVNDAKTGENSYKLTFKHVKELAKAFPQSFDDDPFYKKASLLMIAMAGFGKPRGIDIEADVPVAADYRLPQTLESKEILSIKDENLKNAITNGRAIHEDHPAVQHLRAASIVASDKIAKIAGFNSAQVDVVLWSKLDTPHIMVPTMRF